MIPRRPSVTLLRALVANESSFVAATRKYLTELILACFQNRAEALPYAERVATASAELLENALKYSPAGTDLVVRLGRTDTELSLRVSNSLRGEGRTVLDFVRHEIGVVWGERDAKEAFRKKVMASLADPKSKAMLGYAKIRMETGARLHAHLGSRGRLDVTLTFPLEPPPQPVR